MTSDGIGIFLSQDNFSGYLLKPKILEFLKFHDFIIFRKIARMKNVIIQVLKSKTFP